MLIYMNGQLENFTSFSGDIHSSPVDMEIGQILPDDPNYSFRGVLDEIKIFDYALLPDSVAAESGNVISGIEEPGSLASSGIELFPNPAGDYLTMVIPEIYEMNTLPHPCIHF
jgi:hypothetical protein